MNGRKTAYWCVNFDAGAGPQGGLDREHVLHYGLQQQLWLMQYQYHHNRHDFQDNQSQRGSITRNWKAAGGIRPNDWCAAYLRHRRFYAIGKVISRRMRPGSDGPPIYQDTIRDTLHRRSHIHFDGIVEYMDAGGAFYEDFTDEEWNLPNRNPDCAYCQARPTRQEVWRYPQRIDVAEWQQVVLSGVPVDGIATAALSSYRCAAFRVTEEFFRVITDALVAAGGA